MSQFYTAYVGSYTDINTCKGLTIFDVDVERGDLKKRGEVEVSNATYLINSPDRRYLYAATDKGVASFRILPDGNLRRLNTAAIRGMRGCHLSTTADNRFLFVSGYFDGKITVLHINEDGSVGPIADGIFHKGPGSVAERNLRPHVRCAVLTPDEKYLCVADSGIDQIKIYRFHHETGELTPADVIRCRLQAAPCFLLFSPDGKYLYTIKELSNKISVYTYDGSGKQPVFEQIQAISTLGKQFNDYSAAVTMEFAKDSDRLLCTNAGDHSLGIFERDRETGLLRQMSVLPISGKYPTDVCVFPDEKHLFCTNYDSSTLTFFRVDFNTGLIVMSRAPIPVDQPECALIVAPMQEE